MSPSQDDALLNRTVKTMMSHICKIALTYCCELLIEGTIGLTIDKQKVIVIHFDDRILPSSNACSSSTCNGSTCSTNACSTACNGNTNSTCGVNTCSSDTCGAGACTSGSTNPSADCDDVSSASVPVCSTQETSTDHRSRQQGGEALSSISSLLSGTVSGPWGGSTASTVVGGSSAGADCHTAGAGLLKAAAWEPTLTSSKMMNCFQSTNHSLLSQTLNETIAIDSDTSNSLDDIRLEPMSSRRRYTTTTRVTRSCWKSLRHGYDTKDVKDKGLFKPSTVLDEGMSEDLKSPSQVCTTPHRIGTSTSVDCESPDAADSRSLFSDISPPGFSDFDVKSGFEFVPGGGSGTKPMCSCEICGRRVQTLCQLEAHLVSKHGVVESTQLGKITHFACPVCTKQYRFQAQLDKHMVRHESDRPFRCKECRNAYRYEESLLLHRQAHSNRLTCTLCNKTYSNKVLFQKHIAYMHEKAKDSKV